VFETPEAALTLTPGQLLVLPAHESYAYGVSTGSWRILWFHLSLRKTWHSLEAHRWHVRRSHEVAALLAAAEGFLRETERSGEAAPRLALLYTEVLSHLLRREVAAGLDPHARHLDEQLWMLWRVVASDLAHPWSVHELARHVHMSPGHFHRVMSRNYQITPMRKVVELRMQRAAALLAHTDESVAKIGAEVGYDDAFAFSVAFKRYHAMSPRSFRNDAAGASQA